MMSSRVKKMFDNLEKNQQEPACDVIPQVQEALQDAQEELLYQPEFTEPACEVIPQVQEVLQDATDEVLYQPKVTANDSILYCDEYQPVTELIVDSSVSNCNPSFFDMKEAIMSAQVVVSVAEHCETLAIHDLNFRSQSCTKLLSPVVIAEYNPNFDLLSIDAEQTDAETGNNNLLVSPEPLLPADTSDKNIDSIPEQDFETDDSLERENDIDYFPEQDPETDDNLEQENSNTEIITEDNNERERQKSRKRKRDTENWPRSIRKQKRNLGKSYLTSKKKEVPKRSLQDPCTDKCKQKCITKISEPSRAQILTSFWKLGDVTRQRQFIGNNTEDIKPKYRYIKENSQRKNSTQAYYFYVNKEKIRVCKKFFMSTLNIGDSMIRTALKKSNDKKIVSPDLRGKHGNHKKLDPELKAGVRKHIESLPTVESHYLRQQTERTYIEGDLTLATLYRDYKRECEEAGQPFVKTCIYENIFNFEYNIGWHRPKKDQCSICERYKNSSPEEKEERQIEYEKHLADKTKSREEKQKDVLISLQDPTTVVAVYDLQSVLSTPCSQVSDFYYKSKLATYNFTIFNIGNKEGSCYVWSENTARRGANEIGSCILQFLTSNCKEKHVTFYSDNCAGQNKNKYIASLYLYATTFLEIQSITHKFLITGHTQNEGDSMHSCIEKEKKRLLKGGPIYIPAQWIPVIQGAKKKGKPYHVKEMDQTDFFDLQKLSNDIGMNFITDIEKNKVKWTEIKVIMTTKDKPDSLYFKYEYGDDIPYSEIKVRNNNVSLRSSKRNTRNERQFNGELSPAYSEELKISKQKKDGLVTLCQKNLIPKPYHRFFMNLPSE